MILRILATIITGIGGHYLNRRWDKAVFFLCLFFLYGVAVYIFSMFAYQSLPLTSENIANEFDQIAKRTSLFFVVGEAAIWLVSIVVTAFDTSRDSERIIVRWTISGVSGAVITSLFSFAFLASTAWTFITVNQSRISEPDLQPFEGGFSNTNETDFYESIYFGGSPPHSLKLTAPPTGTGILKGRVTYKDTPAVGITLSVTLNSKHKAKNIVTDSNGVFTINLPEGPWTINSIQTKKWLNKSGLGSYTLYYGGEEKLKGDEYHRYGFGRRNGLAVHVDTQPGMAHINITINDDIDMLFPDPAAKGTHATISDSLKWAEHPNADKYYIEVNKVTRKGSTTHYRQVASRLVSKTTSIPLSSFTHMKSENTGMAEYSVNLYAFSEDGTLIAEAEKKYPGGTFVLTDGNVFIEKKLDDQFNLGSIQDRGEFEEKIEAISREEQRATAARTLIDEEMLDEAESLLQKMDSEYSQGKKESLMGFIYALQNKCEKANQSFEEASLINPEVCIPDSYKAGCL